MDNNYSELTDSLSGVSDDYGNDRCGEFSKDIRNLIVTIMKSGCISYADNEEIYNLYLRNRRQVNSYLAEGIGISTLYHHESFPLLIRWYSFCCGNITIAECLKVKPR